MEIDRAGIVSMLCGMVLRRMWITDKDQGFVMDHSVSNHSQAPIGIAAQLAHLVFNL